MNTVSVRLFAGLRQIIGKPSIEVEVPDGATVSTLKERIEQEYPLVRALSSSLVCAINEEYVPGDHPVRAGDDVALIPPVSGGSTGTLSDTNDLLRPLLAHERHRPPLRSSSNRRGGARCL